MNLPENVILEILLRLPARSVVRFRCVCNGWCAVIKSSVFKDKHLSLKHGSVVGDDVIVFYRYLLSDYYNIIYWSNVTCYDYESLQISYADESSSNDFDITSYFPIEYTSFSCNYGNIVTNHVNGIICNVGRRMTLDEGNCCSIILINPTIREIRKVPITDLGFKYFTEGLGFGFDEATNEYKVVGVVTVAEEGCYHKHIGIVYHLSKNTWNILGEISSVFCKEDSKSNSYSHITCYRNCTFSHGSVHWLVSPFDSSPVNRILTFNMTSELFEVIQFPQVWEEKTYYYEICTSLFTIEQSTITLVAVENFRDYEQTTIVDYSTLDVWVMKEYGIVESWTKLYSLSPFPEKIMNVYCLWRKDKIFFRTQIHETICYDLSKNEAYQPYISYAAIEDFVTCIESFVSVKL